MTIDMKTKSEARRFFEELRGAPMTFGRMIRSLRLSDELSQANLARKLEVSRAHLCDVEHDRRPVSVRRAAEFAKIMGYSEIQFVSVVLDDQLREAGVPARVELLREA